MPGTSLATSIPVAAPKPIRRHVSYRIRDDSRVFRPSCERDLGGDDVARVRDRVAERHPAHRQVVGVVDVGPAAVDPQLARCRSGGCVGVTVPRPIAAVAVSILNTEPGS